jgi:lipopolysaccharide biosynthesis protein
MKTLTIKVPDELFAEISRAAELRKVPKSEVVRERLQARSTAAGSAGTSLWDRMEDLVISSDSLPKDLSANKKHLKGYGEDRSH